jgi:hypothetical protein
MIKIKTPAMSATTGAILKCKFIASPAPADSAGFCASLLEQLHRVKQSLEHTPRKWD